MFFFIFFSILNYDFCYNTHVTCDALFTLCLLANAIQKSILYARNHRHRQHKYTAVIRFGRWTAITHSTKVEKTFRICNAIVAYTLLLRLYRNCKAFYAHTHEWLYRHLCKSCVCSLFYPKHASSWVYFCCKHTLLYVLWLSFSICNKKPTCACREKKTQCTQFQFFFLSFI